MRSKMSSLRDHYVAFVPLIVMIFAQVLPENRDRSHFQKKWDLSLFSYWQFTLDFG